MCEDLVGRSRTPLAGRVDRSYPDDDLWPPESSKRDGCEAQITNLSSLPQTPFAENYLEAPGTCKVNIPKALAIVMCVLRSKHEKAVRMRPPHIFLFERPPPLTERRRDQYRRVALWLLKVERTDEEIINFLAPASPYFCLQVAIRVLRFIKPCPLALSCTTYSVGKHISLYRDGHPFLVTEAEGWNFEAAEYVDNVTTPRDMDCLDQECYLSTYFDHVQLTAMNVFIRAIFEDLDSIENKRLKDCVGFILAHAAHMIRNLCCSVIQPFCPEYNPTAILCAARQKPHVVKLFIQRMAEELGPALLDLDPHWFLEQVRHNPHICDRRAWLKRNTTAFKRHIMMNILCLNSMCMWTAWAKLGDVIIHTIPHDEACTDETCACRTAMAMRTARENPEGACAPCCDA